MKMRRMAIDHGTQTRPTSRILAFAMLLYAVSLIKFFLRRSFRCGCRSPGSYRAGSPDRVSPYAATGFSPTRLETFRVSVSYGIRSVWGNSGCLFRIFLLSSPQFCEGIKFHSGLWIAVVASSAFGSAQVIKYLYYSILIVLVTDL